MPDLPFLPGNVFPDPHRKDFKKSHVFDYINGIPVVQDRSPDAAALTDSGSRMDEQQDASHTNSVTTDATSAVSEGSALPAWVVYDRKVLRFYGYFFEAVPESQVETQRVRYCIIYYYREDDSIHVAEPRQENSGIPQGMFIKRHRIPKAGGNHYRYADFSIGCEISLYGRNITVYDADSFTRRFFDESGTSLGPAVPRPDDSYQSERSRIEELKRAGPPKPKDDPLKRFMEAQLGAAPNILSEDTRRKFIENDRKVLRFYAIWDDGEQNVSEKRPFVLHFFLADDTVEVLEVMKGNSGRDPFPALLKRQRLPSKYKSLDDLTHASSFVQATDLAIGKSVDVFGRNFFIYDCDKATRTYYAETLGVALAEPVDVSEKRPPRKVAEIPPHNGFGSEEDSLGSHLYLVSKPVKRDFQRLLSNDGKVLRFRARLETAKVDDIERRFIVSHYLADDSISVFEPPVKNTGIWGGKFLEKIRLTNPDTGRYFAPGDFATGRKLNINHFTFVLLDPDQYTVNWMLENGYDPHAAHVSDDGQHHTEADDETRRQASE